MTRVILSVVESCRRLKLPVRDYLAAVLPGFADLPIQFQQPRGTNTAIDERKTMEKVASEVICRPAGRAKGQLVARPAWNPSKQPLNFAV